MKHATFIVIASFLSLVSIQCTAQQKVNQFDKHHQKIGLWVERDSGYVNWVINGSDEPKDTNSYSSTKRIWCGQPDYPAVKSTSHYLIVGKGSYINDKKNGEWKYYLNDSIIVKRSFYRQDALDSIFMYTEKKELVVEGRSDWDKGDFVYTIKFIRGSANGHFPLFFLEQSKDLAWMFRLF